MKKTFQLEDLDCASCAAKMEEAVRQIEGVNEVEINFMWQKMTLDAADDRFEDVLKKAKKQMRKIEPDVHVIA